MMSGGILKTITQYGEEIMRYVEVRIATLCLFPWVY